MKEGSRSVMALNTFSSASILQISSNLSRHVIVHRKVIVRTQTKFLDIIWKCSSKDLRHLDDIVYFCSNLARQKFCERNNTWIFEVDHLWDMFCYFFSRIGSGFVLFCCLSNVHFLWVILYLGILVLSYCEWLIKLFY